MSDLTIWIVIALIAVAGLGLRAAFLLLPFKGEIPPRLEFVLGLVPPAALSALVVPAILAPEGTLDLLTPAPIAGLVALIISLRTGNLALTMVVGLVAYAGLDLVI